MEPFQFASQRVRTQRERGVKERDLGRKIWQKGIFSFADQFLQVYTDVHLKQQINASVCLSLKLPPSEILPLISHSLSKVLSLGCSATTNPTTSSAPQCCTVLCSDPFRNIPFACSIHQSPASLFVAASGSTYRLNFRGLLRQPT